MTAANQERKERIVAIANQLIIGQLESGDLDYNDDAAMDAALKQAVADAAAVYDAAMEYLT